MFETRVEKFREYREEIQNSFLESEITTKKKTSDRIKKINGNNADKATSSISFDELMNAYELYDKNGKNKINPLLRKRSHSIPYILLAFFVCSLFLGLSIFFGLVTFGGINLWNE